MIKQGKILKDSGSKTKCITDCEGGGYRAIKPYGYYCTYPENTAVAVQESYILGEIASVYPEKGEILIQNQAGAYILLKNDGRVIINGREL